MTSYFFYGYWDYRFLALIFTSSLIDYICALKIANNSKHKKTWLKISLLSNLGLLIFFKYFNFFIESFRDLSLAVGLNLDLTTLEIILPVGISFYTFQTLSYTIDVYREKMEPTRDFLSFLAYVSFFPQLVAGPIERASHLLPQFQKPRVFNYQGAAEGMRLIGWGLFKKVVIADNCAIYADQIFSNYTEQHSLTLLLGSIYFAFQIYGDFSGYSDMAIGISKLFGFSLMTNFKTPYFSRDIAEFWRRWHISLSTWFRDYLYIPLGGSQVNTLTAVRNIFIIFLVSGFWHGANWTFIFWGLLNAIYFLPLYLLGLNRKHLAHNQETFVDNIVDGLKILLTFLLVCLTWVFFRSETLSSAFEYIYLIFTNYSIDKENIIVGSKELSILLSFFLILEWKIFRHENFQEIISNKHFLIRHSFYIVLMYLLLNDSVKEKMSFIYFQF